jgi:hypothetical protein
MKTTDSPDCCLRSALLSKGRVAQLQHKAPAAMLASREAIPNGIVIQPLWDFKWAESSGGLHGEFAVRMATGFYATPCHA